jgi:hypothetical protein
VLRGTTSRGLGPGGGWAPVSGMWVSLALGVALLHVWGSGVVISGAFIKILLHNHSINIK